MRPLLMPGFDDFLPTVRLHIFTTYTHAFLERRKLVGISRTTKMFKWLANFHSGVEIKETASFLITLLAGVFWQ